MAYDKESAKVASAMFVAPVDNLPMAYAIVEDSDRLQHTWGCCRATAGRRRNSLAGAWFRWPAHLEQEVILTQADPPITKRAEAILTNKQGQRHIVDVRSPGITKPHTCAVAKHTQKQIQGTSM